MADFSTSASLELEVSRQSLRNARSTIEQELGEIEVGVSASGGGGANQLGDILSTNRRQLELMEVQTNLLDEIKESTETGALGGGGGGGGSTNILATGGISSVLGGGAAGAGLLGGGLAAAGLGLGVETFIGLMGGDTPGKRRARAEYDEINRRRERQRPQVEAAERNGTSLQEFLSGLFGGKPKQPQPITREDLQASMKADQQILDEIRKINQPTEVDNTLNVEVNTEQDVNKVVDELSKQQDRNLQQFKREIERSITR